ncbi:unnamed protein product [Phytophthora fragariaefolia]|uniref:Unnamed protein product n=1 Tax=Phytophthora fragariaefolia TaxID=1490495 RepID=A0A9W6XFG5_9STRA|nr:unnamed protein product [Phytophthora fragariaefolia]
MAAVSVPKINRVDFTPNPIHLVLLLKLPPATIVYASNGTSYPPSTDADMDPPPSARRGEGLFAESQPRSYTTPRVSDEQESLFIELTTFSDVGVGPGLTSRTSPPRPPSPPGDTTSDAEHKSDSARQVTLESLECLLRFQASQREQDLAELARFVAFSLTRPVAPSDRAQRDGLLSATTVHELGDALRRQFAGSDSAAVIADLRTELQVVQQINASLDRRLDTHFAELADLQGQLKEMTLERDRLLDLSKQSTAFPASLRKSVAKLEAQVASARAVPDAEIAAGFRHAGDFKRQVLDRDQEIATLRASIVDSDHASATMQGVATKHFTQLQESARLLTDGGCQPLRHAREVIAHQRAAILRQKRVIARQGSIPVHDPHMAVAAAAGLDTPGLSPSGLRLNARLCCLLAERFPEAMVIPSGETRTLELQVGSRRDGSATIAPASTPRRQDASSPASSNSGGQFVSGVDSAGGDLSSVPRSRRTLGQLRRAWLKSLTPAERLRRLSHPVSATAAGSGRRPHQPPDQPYSIPLPGEEGHEEVMDLLAGDDWGAVDHCGLDPAVVGSSSSCELTTGSATSNSAATAPGSALPVQVSISIPVGSAVDVPSRSVAVSSVPAANPAEFIACTPISAAVPTSVSGVVAASIITPDSTRAAASASSTTAVSSPPSSVATVAPVPDPAVSAVSTWASTSHWDHHVFYCTCSVLHPMRCE